MTLQQVTGAETHGAPRAPDGLAATATAEVFVSAPAASQGVGNRTMEIATSIAFAALGGIALTDSVRLGAGWGADGPQSGYFPFWIATLLVAAALANLVAVARAGRPARAGTDMFLTWEQARTVATVLVPTTLYVAAIPFAGIYVTSIVLVAWFMTRLGGFSLWRSIPAGLATAVVTFVVFEIWFLVALPKGPIEEWLGF